MSPQIHFILPSYRQPTGGTNILVRMADCLTRHGRSVCLLYGRRKGGYRFWPHDLPEAYDPALVRSRNPKNWLPYTPWHPFRASGPTQRLTPAVEDWIAVPEVSYPHIAALYPKQRKILVVQDVFGFFRAFGRDAGGRALRGMSNVVATSEASFAAVKTVYEGPVNRITLPVDLPGLDYAPQKQLQIAYLPRKRPVAPKAVASVLAQDNNLADFSICEISNVPQHVLVQRLMESLIFLSFSKEEGFGLPPAEAMRAGCIVIGMTGVGGEEYFTSKTGIVVPDSDIVGMISATRDTIAEYRKTPERLDDLRRTASRPIAETYSVEAFEKSTLAFWNSLG